MPERETPGAAWSLPFQRSVNVRPRTARRGPRALETGARRSSRRARAIAAPASRIPQPSCGSHAVPRAVSLSSRTISLAERSGFMWRTSAAAPATTGTAIDVPCRYA